MKSFNLSFDAALLRRGFWSADIEKAVSDKIVLNEGKYPVELAKDNAIKYNNAIN